MAAPAAVDRAIAHDKTELYAARAQAPSPSKNYHQVVVNSRGVVFRTWKIDPPHGIHHVDLTGSSTEATATFEDFLVHEEFHAQIKHIFGDKVLADAVAAAKGATGSTTFLTA